jgi:glycosyltransferase involved in cell wall biosynthesis
MNPPNITIFLDGDKANPSCYYRGYELARILKEQNISVEVKPSIVPTYPWNRKMLKIPLYIINFIKKIFELAFLKKNTIIFVHRAIAPLGSPFVEWIAKKVFKRKMVYDLDDACFLPSQTLYQKLIGPYRTKMLVSLSDIVFVGSHFIEEYAKRYNPKVFLLPTSIDTEKYRGIKKQNNTIIIGWTGSPTNVKYLNLLKKPLEELAKKYSFEFRIMTAQAVEQDIPSFDNVKVKFIPWSREKEWEEISQFDIGVMPLLNTPWEQGKCAFKAIQYMVLDIPAICSSVGENNYLIKHGINGLLASSDKEWSINLEKFILDSDLRDRLGQEGRKTIENSYSLRINSEKVIQSAKDLLSVK